MPDAIQALAEECGVSITMEPVIFGPRDVLAGVDEADRHYLVSIGAEHPAGPVRMVFRLPLGDEGSPSIGRVLSWLAGDVWVVERSGFRLEEWAAVYGLPDQAAGMREVFECHASAAKQLKDVLGEVCYRRLLALYETSL